MQVLVVENYDNTGLGQVGTALAEAGAKIDLRRAHRGDPLPKEVNGYDATVVLGGGQNALADGEYPYFPQLLDMLREFEAGDRAVLGICLGSQMLARAFGGENHIGTASEFGWREVELTEAARIDAVLCALPPRFPIFQWHDDTFTLPARAERLAKNAAAENQAFRIGRATYGIQFHFEADRPLVRDWNAAYGSLIAERHPDWADRFEDEAARHGPDAETVGLAIARAWVKAI
ncbi:type 1 glutamine amidotransferase [Mesorhizobium sp. BAC0120]|uniref:type 1 glutamine amidotransferase n=1 Tax=Mesorhizobium sp. BAC0120 TaxID=3090670 RepID=UPI00298C01FD|nr:type 1 glutamine amidotransferase [Mesorhizobium sp. BAC0120]MDW6025154.1 type 1 glutamine amidotransferase [Mesorhizobium sp. BAC0120]